MKIEETSWTCIHTYYLSVRWNVTMKYSKFSTPRAGGGKKFAFSETFSSPLMQLRWWRGIFSLSAVNSVLQPVIRIRPQRIIRIQIRPWKKMRIRKQPWRYCWSGIDFKGHCKSGTKLGLNVDPDPRSQNQINFLVYFYFFSKMGKKLGLAKRMLNFTMRRWNTNKRIEYLS